jgi:hypothetical protein
MIGTVGPQVSNRLNFLYLFMRFRNFFFGKKIEEVVFAVTYRLHFDLRCRLFSEAKSAFLPSRKDLDFKKRLNNSGRVVKHMEELKQNNRS